MARVLSRAVLAAALVALVGVWSGDARACSSPGFIRTIVPGGGSTGVPTNARIRVRYGHCAGTTTIVVPEGVRLQRDGVPVPGTWTELPSGWHQFAPDGPLLSHTRYEVADRFATCTFSSACNATDWAAAASFMTGAAPDTEPPSLVGPYQLRCNRQVCDAGACCGPYNLWTIDFRWDASEANVFVTAEARADGEWGAQRFELSTMIPLGAITRPYYGCGIPPPPTTRPPDGDIVIAPRVCDVAGNCATGPLALRITDPLRGCSARTEDARGNVVEQASGGAAAKPRSGSGCSVGRATTAAAVTPALLAFLTGALLRKARRRPGRPRDGFVSRPDTASEIRTT